jgi:hypothetical protein
MFDVRKTFDLWPGRYRKARRQSVDLRDIEDREGFPERNALLDDLALGVLLFAPESRDEEDRSAVFAFADASVQVAGLLKRHPFRGVVAECRLRHPEVEDVRSAIGSLRREVGWHIGDAGSGPRAHPGRNACVGLRSTSFSLSNEWAAASWRRPGPWRNPSVLVVQRLGPLQCPWRDDDLWAAANSFGVRCPSD